MLTIYIFCSRHHMVPYQGNLPEVNFHPFVNAFFLYRIVALDFLPTVTNETYLEKKWGVC